jgi:hypothetical protein
MVLPLSIPGDLIVLQSSDSDECKIISDEAEDEEGGEDPNNSGLHVNDDLNRVDEQGRVLVNVGHPLDEEDVFLAPQLAASVKPHQVTHPVFYNDPLICNVHPQNIKSVHVQAARPRRPILEEMSPTLLTN